MFMEKSKFKEDPNHPAKKSVIVHVPSGRYMKYDENKRELYFSGDGSYTIFPSKQRAISARHHGISTEKSRGRTEEWKEIYQVIET